MKTPKGDGEGCNEGHEGSNNSNGQIMSAGTAESKKKLFGTMEKEC